VVNRSIIPKLKAVNYPDVIGALSGGKRYITEHVHLLAAVLPGVISAGRPFEGILVAQNMQDADVDVLVRVITPEKDLVGTRGQISTRQDRPLRIGLHAGEVGFVRIPCICTVQTAVGEGYQLQIEVTVEPPIKTSQRVRSAQGGSPFHDDTIPNDRKIRFRDLKPLTFSDNAAPKPVGGLLGALSSKDNKVTLLAPFEVTKASINALPLPQKPEYFPLWLEADYDPNAEPINVARTLGDEIPPRTPSASSADVAASKKFIDPAISAQAGTQPISTSNRVSKLMTSTLHITPNMPTLDRSTVFFPLLKYLQECYERAEFKLWAGEAVMAAKLFTYILEQGTTPTPFRWKFKLREVLSAAGTEKISVEQLIIYELFTDLVKDAATFGFQLLSQATSENFGTPDEINDYTDRLAAALRGFGAPLDMVHAYLPLIAGGLALNEQVVMPKENPKDTLGVFRKALAQRASVKDETNTFIFETVETLLNLQKP